MIVQPIFTQAAATIARLSGHFIDNRWLAADHATIAVENPADQTIIGHIAAGAAREVDLAVAAARRTFESAAWANLPAAERERLLLRLADLVEANRDEIAAIETLDNGMPFAIARQMAVGSAISAIRYNAGWARRMNGETPPVSVPGNWHGYTTHVPLGVAALIVPWNAPFAITCNKLSAALADYALVVERYAADTLGQSGEQVAQTAILQARLLRRTGQNAEAERVVAALINRLANETHPALRKLRDDALALQASWGK